MPDEKSIVPNNGRTSITMPDEAWVIAYRFAEQDEALTWNREKPNISGGIAKIILEWARLTNFQPEPEVEALAA